MLYGVVIVDKQIIRDRKLSSLFGEEEINLESGEYCGDFTHLTNAYHGYVSISSNLNYGRTYKTIRGAKRFYNEVISKAINGVDPRTQSVVLANITEKWNQMIMESIQQENQRHEFALSRLNGKIIV